MNKSYIIINDEKFENITYTEIINYKKGHMEIDFLIINDIIYYVFNGSFWYRPSSKKKKSKGLLKIKKIEDNIKNISSSSLKYDRIKVIEFIDNKENYLTTINTRKGEVKLYKAYE